MAENRFSVLVDVIKYEKFAFLALTACMQLNNCSIVEGVLYSDLELHACELRLQRHIIVSFQDATVCKFQVHLT